MTTLKDVWEHVLAWGYPCQKNGSQWQKRNVIKKALPLLGQLEVNVGCGFLLRAGFLAFDAMLDQRSHSYARHLSDATRRGCRMLVEDGELSPAVYEVVLVATQEFSSPKTTTPEEEQGGQCAEEEELVT